MLLERLYDEDLAQASYLIGCQASGEALVIDPRRDIQVYRDLAAHHGLTITAVTETHIHADFLSGTRELAAATGARASVSGEGGEDWQYGFEAQRLHDGDTIPLGRVTVTARHTPGHTPEHLSFLVTDGAFADEPGYLLTGDFVFAGDVGRPDLLDEAGGRKGTRFDAARTLFASLKATFLTLPDHVQVHPGHGAGSACGKSLGAVASTTVGYERRHAWWGRFLENDDEQGFVDELLDGQPEAHAYFSRMKRQNAAGPDVLGDRGLPRAIGDVELSRGLSDGSLVLIDTRPVAEVHAGRIPGSLSIPSPGKTATHMAWALDPEVEKAQLVVLAPDTATAVAFEDRIIRVGIDALTGFVPSLDGLETQVAPTVSPEGVEALQSEDPSAVLLDVRGHAEHIRGTIPGAAQLAAGRVLSHRDDLPDPGAARLITFCQSGVRNAVASSALRRAGYDVIEIEGSFAAWSRWSQAQSPTAPAGADR